MKKQQHFLPSHSDCVVMFVSFVTYFFTCKPILKSLRVPMSLTTFELVVSCNYITTYILVDTTYLFDHTTYQVNYFNAMFNVKRQVIPPEDKSNQSND